MSLEVNIVDSFRLQLEATVKKMQAENLDICRVPDSNGFELLRYSSAQAQQLLNQDPVEDLLIPVTIEGEPWLLAL